jgi:alpha,alpha-trehalase
VEPEEAMRRWRALVAVRGHENTSALYEFLESTFLPTGSDLLHVEPPDWTPSPLLLADNVTVTDERLRRFAAAVHDLWRLLSRRTKPEVLSQPRRHTLIAMRELFIVPGGRFQEWYYWDSYWIVRGARLARDRSRPSLTARVQVRGLFASGMRATAVGLVTSLLEVAKHYGFVPK